MKATPHAPGVWIDTYADLTRRDDVLAYANAHGIGWREAIVALVNQALGTALKHPFLEPRDGADICVASGRDTGLCGRPRREHP